VTASTAGSPPLSLRVVTIGLVMPVVLMLAGMAFWPERLGAPGVIVTSSRRFLGTLVIELLLTATLGAWLWRKGWRPHRSATLPFAARDLLRGVGVWAFAFLCYLVWAVLWLLAAPKTTAGAYAIEYVGQPSVWIAVTVSVVNAVFEEMLWLGLGVAAMQAAGVRLGVAATISVTLRVLVHLYQGLLAVVLMAMALLALRASGRT
jgi:hypothetical protein